MTLITIYIFILNNSKIKSPIDSDTKNGGTLIISPISSSPKDISPSNKENIDELNPISNNNNNNLQNQKPTCSLPTVPKINKNMNINTNKILPSLPPNIITTSTNTITTSTNTITATTKYWL